MSIQVGANSGNGRERCGRTRNRYGWSSSLHAYSPYSDGVDGSDELAASIRERSGGVRAAIGFSRADDAGTSEVEAQECAGAGRGQPGGGGKSSQGGAGPFRHLSRDPMNAQVWIAILVGLA